MKLKEYSDRDLARDYDEVDLIWNLVQGCARADMIEVSDPDNLGTAFGGRYALITVRKGTPALLTVHGSIEGITHGMTMPTLVTSYRRIDDLLAASPITVQDIIAYCGMIAN